MQKNGHEKTLRLTQLGILIAVQAILTFTPLGFITWLPLAVSITLMHVPVIIGGVLLGPVYGGVLGLFFGVFSMIKASIAAVSPVDMMFSPLLSGSPVASVVMCVVPRILLGLVAAYLFSFLARRMRQGVAIAVSAAVATAVHTVGVLGLLSLFFKALPLKEVFAAVVAVNGLLEILVAVVIATGVCKPMLKAMHR